jgi:uncharacterized membrane protein YdjX (TVP38/TMEM64 family)
MTPARRRLLVGAALLAAVVAVAWSVDARTALVDTLARIERLGAWGPVLFVALYVVATVLFLPGSILTVGAGAIFGLAKGVLVAWAAATLGAAAAFLVGRYLARDAVARALAASPRFRALDAAVAREGWKIVGLMRLSPVFPFNVLNYAFGITRVPFVHYALASWIGMLPGALVYVYLGALAGDLASLGEAARGRAPVQWMLAGLGLVATVLVAASITRLARRALARRIPA